MACHKLRQAASQRISSRFLNAVCYAVGIFLIPDVLSYHGFVYPDRADIISACPECLVSSSPSPPLRMSVVKHHRTLSFQHTHNLGHRVFRRYPYADMYVVYTDRSLHQLQFIHLKQPLYDVPDFCTAFPVQDFFSIFWYKYYVVCTIPLCMCRTFLLHFLSPVFLSEMRCYRFSTLSRETFSCSITVRVKRTVAPQAEPVDFFWY